MATKWEPTNGFENCGGEPCPAPNVCWTPVKFDIRDLDMCLPPGSAPTSAFSSGWHFWALLFWLGLSSLVVGISVAIIVHCCWRRLRTAAAAGNADRSAGLGDRFRRSIRSLRGNKVPNAKMGIFAGNTARAPARQEPRVVYSVAAGTPGFGAPIGSERERL